MANKRILVPGGAGYIGSHAVKALIGSGAEVIVADDLETGFKQAVDPAAKFYQGDIRDRAFLDDLFDKEHIDGVIHFAAYSQVGQSMEKPLDYYDNNVNGTRVLLSAMLAHGVKNIVFSSTAATYGEPRNIPILESDPTEPTSAYGATKLAMEQMMRWCAGAYGLNYVSLRYFNACGAHESGSIGEAHEPESHLIPLILQVPGGRRPCISVYGEDYPTRDGTCVRDYIHVMDLAEAHLLAMDYLFAGGASDVFNLGNGVGFTVKEVIAAAEAVVAAPIPAKTVPRRPGDPAQLVASSQKARAVLGWKPSRCEFSTIISTAWNWHKNHPNGYGA